MCNVNQVGFQPFSQAVRPLPTDTSPLDFARPRSLRRDIAASATSSTGLAAAHPRWV